MKSIKYQSHVLKSGIMFLLFFIISTLTCLQLHAQTLYVDAINGKNEATGTKSDPLLSLEKAVRLTHQFSGKEEVHLKLAPGLYIITDKLILKTAKPNQDVIPYSIEAAIMPDDKTWEAGKMPVIQSIAGVNDTAGFKHTIGLSVEKSNVSLLGLKFIGNPNSEVPDFYPIRRADKTLTGLTVTQCFFIGEANSAPVQSAFWVSGQGIHVDHCIFHSCKIAFVLGSEVNDFSLTYAIIDGAYNTAFWYGFAGNVPLFTFKNNIITHCNYFMVYPLENGQPNFTLKDSYLTDNAHYLGYYPKAQDKFIDEKNRNLREINISKTGKIKLVHVEDNGITARNLNLSSNSAGKETQAGTFK